MDAIFRDKLEIESKKKRTSWINSLNIFNLLKLVAANLEAGIWSQSIGVCFIDAKATWSK
jgi:hypothetical protein